MQELGTGEASPRAVSSPAEEHRGMRPGNRSETLCNALAAASPHGVPVSSKRTRILVIEDDPGMRGLLEEFLTRHGLSVISLESGAHVVETIVREHVDLVILDLMLPGDDGLSICRRLRLEGIDAPIIMVTAKGDTVDRIVGLEIGADDYLAKPFDPRELLARIGAVLRRHSDRSHGSAAGPVYAFGPFELDTIRRTLKKSGKLIVLKAGEFAVLRALASHAHQPLTRERLVSLARARDFGAHDRSMDIQIARLRRLIEDDASHPCYIRTVWGVGYVFSPEGAGE